MYRLASATFLAFALLALQIQARQTPAQQQPPARPNFIENLLQLDANSDQTIDREEVPESAREAFDKILEQADRNHNSKLEAEEIRAVLEGLRTLGNSAGIEAQARFKAMDADKDGKVSRSEFKGPAFFFDRLDANADGAISSDEFPNANRPMRPGADVRRRFNAAPTDSPLLMRLDKNNDGKVTRDEAEGRFAQFFDRLDTNADGAVTPEEAAKAADRFRTRRPAAKSAGAEPEPKPVSEPKPAP